jgi:hypothetical protein
MSPNKKMNLIDRLSKNIFPISIAILTLTLLFVFGIEQSNENSTDKLDVIDKFYSATLKPIFNSESIDKKDVLNFAVEGDLILDSVEKKVLQVSNDSTGREVIGIINIDYLKADDNYTKIIEKLNLEKKQRMELDSILESYLDALSKSIYKDENKVFAVDPQIALLRGSLNQDLSNFIMKEKKIKSKIENRENYFNQLINERAREGTRDYIVFTPDTVFQREYEFIPNINSTSLNHEIMVIPRDIEKPDRKFSSFDENKLDFRIDTNFVNVTLDNLFDSEEFEDIHLFKTFIDSTSDDLKLSFEVLGDSTDNILLKFSYIDSANIKIRYEMNTNDIGNAVTNSIKLFSGKDLDEWIEYGIKMDSISRKAARFKKNKSENN